MDEKQIKTSAAAVRMISESSDTEISDVVDNLVGTAWDEETSGMVKEEASAVKKSSSEAPPVSGDLRRALEEVRAERDALKNAFRCLHEALGTEMNRSVDLEKRLDNAIKDYEDEKRIVQKIWEQFGNPTYKELNGKSIYDLVDEALEKSGMKKETEETKEPVEPSRTLKRGMGVSAEQAIKPASQSHVP